LIRTFAHAIVKLEQRFNDTEAACDNYYNISMLILYYMAVDV